MILSPIWFEQERKTAFLDTFVNVSRFYDRGRVDFETSIFDDYLRKDDFNELKPSGFDQLTWFNVKDSLGDDTVQLEWGFTGFLLIMVTMYLMAVMVRTMFGRLTQRLIMKSALSKGFQ